MKPNPHIHPQCAQAIQKLLCIKDPAFPDFVALKTYGNDTYSAMGWEELQHYINEQTIMIVEAFEDEANILSALRWVARGLPAAYAIRKARADYSMYRFNKQ
ncbi:hypothetical protein [Aneurinibacillus sp. REN35]|uniref:hypothetical protein n=1 Tax=Aneurinibacillus sp. REN35 TaxID=3237286 RepID=UPI003528108F